MSAKRGERKRTRREEEKGKMRVGERDKDRITNAQYIAVTSNAHGQGNSLSFLGKAVKEHSAIRADPSDPRDIVELGVGQVIFVRMGDEVLLVFAESI